MNQPYDPEQSASTTGGHHPAAPWEHAVPYGSTPGPGAHMAPYGAQIPYGASMVPYGAQPPAPLYADPAVLAVLGHKSVGVTAILSLLLTGAGQMYCGRVGRGLAFLAALLVSYVLTAVAVGFVLVPIVWIWALVDSINLANRHNAELLRRLPGAAVRW